MKFRMTSHREAKRLNTCTFFISPGNPGVPGSPWRASVLCYWCLIPSTTASIPHVMRMVFRSRLVKQDRSYLTKGDISHTEHLRQEVQVAREETRLEPSSWGYTRSLGAGIFEGTFAVSREKKCLISLREVAHQRLSATTRR